MKTNFLVCYPTARGFAKQVFMKGGNANRVRATKDPKRGNRVLFHANRQEFDSISSRVGALSVEARGPREAVADVDFEAHDGTLHKTAEECLAYELQARFGEDVTNLDALAAKIAHFVTQEEWESLWYSGPHDGVPNGISGEAAMEQGQEQPRATHVQFEYTPLGEVGERRRREVSQNLQALSEMIGTPGEVFGIPLSSPDERGNSATTKPASALDQFLNNPERVKEAWEAIQPKGTLVVLDRNPDTGELRPFNGIVVGADLDPDQQAAENALKLIRASLASKSRKPEEIQGDTGLPEAVIYNTLTNHPNEFTKGPGGRWKRK